MLRPRVDLSAITGYPPFGRDFDNRFYAVDSTLVEDHLAPKLGVHDSVTEAFCENILPRGSSEPRTSAAYASFVKIGDNPDGTILIAGDSLNARWFPQMLPAYVHKVIWAYDSLCRFEGQLIDRLDPDEMPRMPSDRVLNCSPWAFSHETGN